MSISERRLNPRARVQIRLELCDMETGRKGTFQTTNLSVDGAECSGRLVLKVGSLLHGKMALPLSEAGRDVDVVLEVKARVTREAPTHHRQGDAACHSFGIEFLDLSNRDRDEMRRFLFE